ncbi:MAG: tRNA uridine-5-carboxymethylaminomethyl(34) synthesis GTPase MnmE [Alphaproteobacteria bacterium]
MSTIYALATAKGRAGVSVLRISGAKAAQALEILTDNPLPSPRRATLQSFRHPETGVLVDRGLALWFPAPKSFTGEDVVELHLHGGPTVVSAMVSALSTIDGLVPALAGEFTRRAFDHGKIDLTVAEGLADLINAETEAQRVQALRQLDGGLSEIYEGWRANLIRALAFLEAEIDFPDEDLPGGLSQQIVPQLEALAADMRQHLADNRRGETLRDGFQVVVLGRPNVGKSSLINALASRDVAIVSDVPGTTRDLIEVRLDLGGYPVTLVDTAGLRESDDAIEREGVRRAQGRGAEADLRLLVFDAVEGLTPLDHEDQDLIVINKIDLADWPETAEGVYPISARTGAGMDRLLSALENLVVHRMSVREVPSLTRARHRGGLMEAVAHLSRAMQAAADDLETELITEDVRLAARAIGRITGRVDVEDILDVVFADFCIGK